MIWFLAAVLAFVILLITYLLLAPLVLEMDSRNSLYRVRFHKLILIDFIPDEFILRIKFLFWTKSIPLVSSGSKTKEKNRKAVPGKRKARINLSKTFSVLRSFGIVRFEMSVDTGSPELNGILYPIMFGLGALLKKEIRINFIDENYIILEIRNNLARMIRAYYFNKS